MSRKRKKRVEVVHVERRARPLVTVAFPNPTAVTREMVEGAIVRVQPLPGSDAEDVANFRKALVELGAVAVKATSVRRAGAILGPLVAEERRDATLITPRQAVDRAIDEALVADKEVLARRCEPYCAKVGL